MALNHFHIQTPPRDKDQFTNKRIFAGYIYGIQ